MEVCGHYHAPAALPPADNLFTLWIRGWIDRRDGREKFLVLPGFETPDSAAHSLVAIPTSLSRLQGNERAQSDWWGPALHTSTFSSVSESLQNIGVGRTKYPSSTTLINLSPYTTHPEGVLCTSCKFRVNNLKYATVNSFHIIPTFPT